MMETTTEEIHPKMQETNNLKSLLLTNELFDHLRVTNSPLQNSHVAEANFKKNESTSDYSCKQT